MGEIIKSLSVVDTVSLSSPFASAGSIGQHAGKSRAHELDRKPAGSLPDSVAQVDVQPIEAALSLSPSTVGKVFMSEENTQHIKELEQEAERTGFERGYTKGELEGRKQHQAATVALKQLVVNATGIIDQTVFDAENIIGSLVFETVCKVLGKQMLSPEACTAIIAEVLSGLQKEEFIEVRISPRDWAYINQHKESGNNHTGAGVFSGLPIVVDDQIALGGCVVKLKDGLIDARIETQLQMFAQNLKEAMLHAKST
ncbi:hypothetical protein ED236_09240 [Pseudomethylobacillus aquaticus]|uniref:Flagellar assembly protein FliH n=1 Tax=Pseudomethylobacillus aquaticus TaxID=2676064 RepID=A0A3N0V035_9PROT|nr:FliH/SctL family protein [Pseudomethylobacillus aquaticus]ROH85904.1 hypothetical protein ED236_09240 [Pseudomethylobacillus aquaticus]